MSQEKKFLKDKRRRKHLNAESNPISSRLFSYVIASRETLSVHVRAINTVLQKSAISSLAFKIAKTSRHHFNLFTSSAPSTLPSLFSSLFPSLFPRGNTRAASLLLLPCCQREREISSCPTSIQ